MLMTRPRAASDRFLCSLPDDLRNATRVCVSPLLRIEHLANTPDLEGATGVIFSSAHGVAATLPPVAPVAAYCVGRATTARAHERGWHALYAGRNARELVASLTQNPPPGSLVHLRGVHGTGDIAASLRAAGLRVSETIIYDQKALPLSPEATAALHRAWRLS